MSEWTFVQELEPDGPMELPSAEYPDPGKPVLVWIRSAVTDEFAVHMIQHGRGWSWPSFGLAWQYIEHPQKQ